MQVFKQGARTSPVNAVKFQAYFQFFAPLLETRSNVSAVKSFRGFKLSWTLFCPFPDNTLLPPCALASCPPLCLHLVARNLCNSRAVRSPTCHCRCHQRVFPRARRQTRTRARAPGTICIMYKGNKTKLSRLECEKRRIKQEKTKHLQRHTEAFGLISAAHCRLKGKSKLLRAGDPLNYHANIWQSCLNICP